MLKHNMISVFSFIVNHRNVCFQFQLITLAYFFSVSFLARYNLSWLTWLRCLKRELHLSFFHLQLCYMHVWVSRPESIIQHVAQVFYGEHIFKVGAAGFLAEDAHSNIQSPPRSADLTVQPRRWVKKSFPLATTVYICLSSSDPSTVFSKSHILLGERGC